MSLLESTPIPSWVTTALSVIAIGWQLVTGTRKMSQETDEQRQKRDEARKREIREESVRAVRESKEFVLRASQDLVNERLLEDSADVKESVRGLNEKLDRILLADTLPIRRRD